MRQPANQPRIHNFAPTFLKFWSAAKGKTLPEQVLAFKAQVVPSFPEYYSFKFEGWKKGGNTPDAEIAAQLRDFPKIEAKFIATTQSITGDLQANLEVFKRTFPAFDASDLDVYIIHSLGEMDGGTREIQGKSRFIFGVDSIAKYHNADSDIPFFHHELFHVYHWQSFSGPEELWTSLWAEGLATYVSEALNWRSTHKDLLLDIPAGLVSQCDSMLPELWKELKAKLRSGSEEDYASFFLFSSKHPRIPRRAGYYLGYLVAKKLAENHSLQELTKLQGKQLALKIDQAIVQLSKQ